MIEAVKGRNMGVCIPGKGFWKRLIDGLRSLALFLIGQWFSKFALK